MPRTYRFFAHFNRVNMQRGDPRVWSIHFRGACFQVESFECRVPIWTSFKKDGRQPRAKLYGKAAELKMFGTHAELR